MRLLLRYLRQRPRLVAFALFCAVCNQAFILLDPLIFRYIIDRYATQAGRYTAPQFISWAGLLLAGALVAALVAWVAKSFQLDAVNRITRGVGIQIYSDAVRHSLGMPYSAFEAQQSGEIMAMIQTARHDVEAFLTLLINAGFASSVAIVFVIVYAARLNWILAPAFLLAAPLLAFASFLLGGKMRDKQRKIVVETVRLAGSATESLRNIEIVKSLGLAKQEVSRLDARSGRIFKMEVEKIRHARRLTFFHGACVNLLRSGLVLLFLYLVFTKQITMGQFFSLFFYSYFIFSPMQEMGNVTTLYQETETSLKNIQAILQAPQEERPARPTPVGPLETITFRNVTFQYPAGSEPAVRGIAFVAERGETIAFVGPSGSGKTTLVKLLTGLYSPHSGEIAYNGIPASQVDLDSLRERIGLVTQDAQLFAGTIRENLIFVKPDAADEACLEALRHAAATDLLARAEQGLDTIIGEGGVRVSGGERQRISIARALLRGPELLVFDEATSALDSLTEEEIVRTMKALHRKRQAITVVIAHRLSTVRHADRIYVLDRGSIAETGKHEELLQRRGLYHDLWRLQTGGTIAQAAV
jgi:ATP-binding cassette subfamily B protein